jgi:hypothetical protein
MSQTSCFEVYVSFPHNHKYISRKIVIDYTTVKKFIHNGSGRQLKTANQESELVP